jgi:ribosome-associated protein
MHTSAPDNAFKTIVEPILFQLNDEYVRVCDLLKLTGIAASGAQGKQMVADGVVSVDGQPEGRKTAKIRPGQTVECRGVKVVVLAQQGTQGGRPDE